MARLTLHKNIQATAILPYVYNLQTTSHQTYQAYGIRDPSLLLFYTRTWNWKNQSHFLSIGGGVKMPLGAYRVSYEKKLLNPYLQPGTGSWDIPLSYQYVFTHNERKGITLEGGYKYNTTNILEIKIGNSTQHFLHAFYKLEKKIHSIADDRSGNEAQSIL
jgi:hypothetical protein